MSFERTLKEANETISKTVFELFNTFANPLYRGKGFAWSEFPEICGTMARTYVAVNIAKGKTWENYAREKAIKLAKRIRRKYGL